MKTIPLVDLKAQYDSIRDEIDRAMREVIDTTAFVGGPAVKEFEKAFAEYCRVPHAIGCANGTDALVLALRALGIGPGDEVIAPSFTFVATVEAVALVGAKPVLADVDPNTLLMDPVSVRERLTRATKVLLPVHLYGQMADMVALGGIAKDHGLKVIEDSAQAHGALLHGKGPGHWGDVATFSFYPGKNLGAWGDAGAMVTRDEALADRLLRDRDHGRQDKYLHEFSGMNSRLDTLQAAVLKAKLPHLDAWTERRQALVARYDEALSGAEGLGLFRPAGDRRHVFHLYVLRILGGNGRRDRIAEALRKDGIGAGVHYPVPLHRQPAFAHLAMETGSLPVSERAGEEVLSLPLYPELPEVDQDRVVESLLRALRQNP